MLKSSAFDYRIPLRSGLLAGVISLSVSAIGMVELFGIRGLIANTLTLGQVLIFAAPVAFSFLVARSTQSSAKSIAVLYGALTGAVAALPLLLLIWVASAFNLRQFFVNISPTLINDLLTFGKGIVTGGTILLVAMTISGAVAAAFCLLPASYQRPILAGLIWTGTVGLFSEILSIRLRDFFGPQLPRFLFASKALRPFSALAIFAIVTAASAFSARRKAHKVERPEPPPEIARRNQFIRLGVIIASLLILPLILGTYLSEVINNVGIYVLMGLGLNIVVGFAGLLDLGYVAFFAIGAYSMAIFTSTGPLGLSGLHLNFWAALPFCVAIAAAAGITLGMPVLRMRGDYLAIVTLGFGEIIRILALSDLLKPLIGGAQGVLQIPKPSIGSLVLVKPEQLYYVVLAGCLLAAFVSWRLSESRLGRQWMALREDEDVAEAMGIKLVSVKLLAFGIGAGFSGLAGAIFASKLTSIFPHSFNILISINVLSLIIVGGMGSLPGVIVGALILVGLPELLREFAEYRLLMYGALLIVMMLARPEGFIPSTVRKRELEASRELAARAAPVKAGD